PLIPFANSHLKQTTLLDVASGGRLWFWDGFMTGRVGSGESWQFRELQSETRLCSNERLIYLDRFRLFQAERGQARSTRGQARGAMGPDTYTGIGLYVGKEARCVASELRQSMPNAGVDALAENVAI